MPSALETDWLTYARRVVEASSHQIRCAKVGERSSAFCVDATDVRWPGYLGRNVQVGRGLLVVGNIHREFASGGVDESTRDLIVDATRQWQRFAMTDDKYLEAVRTGYARGYECWDIFRSVREVVERASWSFDDVVYTNAAKCQQGLPDPGLAPKERRATNSADGRIMRDLQTLCLSEFPIYDLIDIVRPKAVLFLSAAARDSVAGLRDLPTWVNVNSRINKPSVTKCHRLLNDRGVPLASGANYDAWVQALAHQLRT